MIYFLQKQIAYRKKDLSFLAIFVFETWNLYFFLFKKSGNQGVFLSFQTEKKVGQS